MHKNSSSGIKKIEFCLLFEQNKNQLNYQQNKQISLNSLNIHHHASAFKSRMKKIEILPSTHSHSYFPHVNTPPSQTSQFHSLRHMSSTESSTHKSQPKLLFDPILISSCNDLWRKNFIFVISIQGYSILSPPPISAHCCEFCIIFLFYTFIYC